MGRLSHLKVSLPKLVSQDAREVIVVDYSCPERTGDYVKANFPTVRVVSIEGKNHFSNWEARNSGASAATSDVLVFVDADIILADGALYRLAEHLPQDAYGFFTSKNSAAFNPGASPLAANQLRGFHVVPTAAFRKVRGYDELFEGYASGADTDFEDRLRLIGLRRCALEPSIIETVIEHDTKSRLQHHKESISESYFAGLLYRTAKLHVLRLVRKPELELLVRRRLHLAAKRAVAGLPQSPNRLSMTVLFKRERIWVPGALHNEPGIKDVSLRIDVSLNGPIRGFGA